MDACVCLPVSDRFVSQHSDTSRSASVMQGGSSSSASSADEQIKRILRAANHFDMLRLSRPHADLMGQPVWEPTPDDVHRAFRRLSLCCHPDKSTHPEAPRAFEALKRAKACLAQPLERDDYLLEFIRNQKTSWEGNWSSAGVASDSRQRATSMREEARRAETEVVVDAMRERRERAEAAARKKQRVQAAQQRRSAELPSGAALDDDDDEDATAVGAAVVHARSGGVGARPAAGAARKRPKFM